MIVDHIITLVESFQEELDKLESVKAKAIAVRDLWCLDRPTLLACVLPPVEGTTYEEKLASAQARSGMALEQHLKALLHKFSVPVDDSFQSVVDPLIAYFKRFIKMDPMAKEKTGL